ncbi:MAG: hypothetical protein KFH98_07450 [Gemmatimonadetes bacterium]|nr:hypothetical protein [Gemmatimonadota bacterium]
MMKKILTLIVLLAIVWAVPALRNRIGLAAVPVLEKLGPAGEKAANPFRRWEARNELSFYLRMMNDDRTEARALPDERDFSEWVRRRMPEETGIDPWGGSYWLRRRGNEYIVGSNGPDGVRDTPDDVTQSATM